MDAELSYIEIPALLDLIKNVRSAVLTTHVNPDGDALGSEGAMARFLGAQGIDVRIVNADPVPPNLALLESGARFETWDAAEHVSVLRSADLIMCLDFNQSDRVREMRETMIASDAMRVVVDHHLHPRPFAQHYLTVTDASSTAEIVFDILTQAGFHIDRETANALYVGIMTDTGSFRFERTTPRLHRVTADLLETGLNPMDIHRRIYDDYPMGRTVLLGRILAGIEQHCGGKATLLTVTRQMLDETGTTIDDVENIVNYGLAIRGVELTALLTEQPEGWKISFRSRGALAVNDIAAAFGGGGHRLASGARVEGRDLAALKKDIVQRFCDAIDERR